MDERASATLYQTISIQERMLNGCEMIFSGMRKSSDPLIVEIAEEALAALTNTRLTLEAMIDGYNETKH